jgi:hypothetical protein
MRRNALESDLAHPASAETLSRAGDQVSLVALAIFAKRSARRADNPLAATMVTVTGGCGKVPDPVSNFSYSQYVDGMRIPAERAQPFARELKHAAPRDMSPTEKRAIKLVFDLARDIDRVLKDRSRLSGAKIRPVVSDFVSAWGGMSDALLGIARMPSSLTDRPTRAADLHARLFPDGVLWLRSDAQALWSHANRLLERIEEESMLRDLERLLGRDFHVAVVKLTGQLGEAIGVGRVPRETLSPNGLQLKVQELSRAVAAYCRQLVASVDESSPRSIERFRRAVAPIDAYRTRSFRVGEPDVPESPEEPEDPDPEEPDEPEEPEEPATDPIADEPGPAIV